MTLNNNNLNLKRNKNITAIVWPKNDIFPRLEYLVLLYATLLICEKFLIFEKRNTKMSCNYNIKNFFMSCAFIN